MKDPINVVVSNYPTLAIYFDPIAETKEIRHRLALGLGSGHNKAEREATERHLDSVAWKIRWTTQHSGKSEVLMGVYNFPTNNLMLTSSVNPDTYNFPVADLVMEKLEELHQAFLTHPDLVVVVETQHPVGSTLRPDFNLELRA
jgi:hypothetical protein